MPYEVIKVPSTGIGKQIKSQKPQESAASTLGRGALRTAGTIASTALGTPGDLLQTIGNLTTASNRYFNPGEEIPDFQSILPTSQQLQSGLESVSGAFKPQSGHEEAYDQLVGDITSLLVPSVLGKGKAIERLTRVGKALPRAAAVGGAGNLAHFVGKQFHLSEPKNNALKLGTMLLTSIGLDKGLKGVIEKNYAKVNEVPDSYMVKSRPALDKLRNMKLELEENAYKNKDVVKDVLDAATNSFRDGKIGFKKAWDLTKQANEHWPSAGKQARKELDKIKDVLYKDVIQDAYRTTNDRQLVPLLKDAAEGITAGNALFSDVRNASRVREWVNKNLNFTKYAGGGVIAKLLGVPAGAAAGVSLGVPVAKGAFNFLEPILRSRNIRSAYAELIGAAAKENVVAANKSLAKLNKAIEKEMPELGGKKGRYQVIQSA